MIEEDVRNFLLLNPSVSGCTAPRTFVGPIQPSRGGYPSDVVAIQAYGGLMPHGFIDGTKRKTQLKTDVQLRVRGAIGSYLTTKARADAIWHYLNMPSTASIGGATVDYSIVQHINACPLYIGENKENQPEFTINTRFWSIIDP